MVLTHKTRIYGLKVYVIVPSAPRTPNFSAENIDCFAAAIADSRNKVSPSLLDAE